MMRAVRPRGISTRTGTPHRELFGEVTSPAASAAPATGVSAPERPGQARTARARGSASDPAQ